MRVMFVLVFHSFWRCDAAFIVHLFIHTHTHTHTRVVFYENEGVHDFARFVMHAALRKSVVHFDQFLGRGQKAEAEGGEGGKRGRSKRKTKCKGREKKVEEGWLC